MFEFERAVQTVWLKERMAAFISNYKIKAGFDTRCDALPTQKFAIGAKQHLNTTL